MKIINKILKNSSLKMTKMEYSHKINQKNIAQSPRVSTLKYLLFPASDSM